ncbi:MAG TPA: hypothetical protein P5266_06650 [Candidatus Fermentibacter sp.]|nr:hypothetical protein [Candidatus Fermentibacter sp.]
MGIGKEQGMTGTIISVAGGDSDLSRLDALGAELSSRGAGVEIVHPQSGNGLRDRSACTALARHGVTVVTSLGGFESAEGFRVVSTDLAEIGDAERLDSLLRKLELAGIVPPPAGRAGAEEDAVRDRLRRLGYL